MTRLLAIVWMTLCISGAARAAEPAAPPMEEPETNTEEFERILRLRSRDRPVVERPWVLQRDPEGTVVLLSDTQHPGFIPALSVAEVIRDERFVKSHRAPVGLAAAGGVMMLGGAAVGAVPCNELGCLGPALIGAGITLTGMLSAGIGGTWAVVQHGRRQRPAHRKYRLDALERAAQTHNDSLSPMQDVEDG